MNASIHLPRLPETRPAVRSAARAVLFLAAALLCSFVHAETASAASQAPAPAGEAPMVRLVLAGAPDRPVLVRMNDNDAARDFLSLLPLEIAFSDFNGTEKTADLPRKLSLGNSPTSFDPEKGSFAHFIPWGNLAVFYRDFRYSRNLVPLGKVESGLDVLAGVPDGTKARVERVR